MRLCCSHNVSPRRFVLPRRLPSTRVTSLQRYYAPSDFLATISAPSLLHLSADTSIYEANSGRIARISHVYLSALVACHVLRPRRCSILLPIAVYEIVLSDLSTSSATSEMALTRLNHFSHMAYGLQLPCLRLAHAVTDANPRLGMECVRSTLFQSHFQRLVDKHFVAHR